LHDPCLRILIGAGQNQATLWKRMLRRVSATCLRRHNAGNPGCNAERHPKLDWIGEDTDQLLRES
jgi:hypothetical protein